MRKRRKRKRMMRNVLVVVVVGAWLVAGVGVGIWAVFVDWEEAAPWLAALCRPIRQV